ncbi:Transcription factor SPEECHLESS [Rhynchospora pubera]|uniref:Transcription factor SPEECHLESS n=1 Tax=Rhynchospora pubera TaxID=906938 RepID=A0AAV8F5E4_9POAL|nr:Transcription factor SPEECHLESS [Rhynchospora pubera]
MVKLSTARDFRVYGPGGAGDKWEYINAGLFLFSGILLIGGFLAQFSSIAFHIKSGLALVLISLLIISLVNVHDWIAHLAGIDWRLGLAEYDQQLALVEIVLPVVNVVGSVLFFVAVLFFEIEMDRGYRYKLEKHGLNLLIAGPVLLLVGSIGNICQVYDRSNWHVQILQKCVQVPLLMGSFLFVVGGIINLIEISRSTDLSFKMLDKSWAWFGLFGSVLLLIGGLMNLVKVFKVQQMDGSGLERLRGGARERLRREREGQVPLLEDSDTESQRKPVRKPYKDVLVESSQA